MSITSLSGFSAIQQQQGIQRAQSKLQAAIAQIVSGNKLAEAADNVSALSVATQLQSQVSGLKQISGNIAQASSQLEVADGGAEQISNILVELQNLAQRANSPTVNPENRKALNEQFQQLTQQIDQIAQGTKFNGQSLLDGSVSGDSALSFGSIFGDSSISEVLALPLPNLFSPSLFSGNNLTLLNQENAASASDVIADALNTVTGARADIGGFQQALDYATANVASAIANQDAARSTLSDADFAEQAVQLAQATVQQNASISLAAQGNRLSPILLQLIG